MLPSYDKRYIDSRLKEMETEIQQILLTRKTLDLRKKESSLFRKIMLKVSKQMISLGKRMEVHFGSEKCQRPLDVVLRESR